MSLSPGEALMMELFCARKAVRFAEIATLAPRLTSAVGPVLRSLIDRGLVMPTPNQRDAYHLTEAGELYCQSN